VTAAALDPVLLDREPYTLAQAEKEALLAARLSALTEHHRASCPGYARVLDLLWDGATGPFHGLGEVPWLPVQLFKTHELRSIPEEEIFKVLTSSGTTGAATSRIFLDRDSAALQTRTLAVIMAALLGSERRPMIIVDARETLRDRRAMAARAAGILGFQTFGRDHLYALDAELRLRRDELVAWLREHSGEPVFVFGFTFMVWRHLLDALAPGEIDLSRAVLVHGGGWKQLQAQAVSPERFRARLAEVTGLRRVASFYGMVEQIGTVFLECERGRLHAPNAADVLIRNPDDWSIQPDGEPGIVQVLSALPTSYPGHSLLTEDLGTVHGRDDCGCGWLGAAVELHGRVPRAELRGCSDTHAANLEAAA
jgi:phenylacetate-coenzyme A ligase PaaK-like adenylate-forming protein